MKITFIQAEAPDSIHDVQFPSGIAALEAVLTRAGHDVFILWRVADWLTLEKVGKRLQELKPDAVCISFCFSVMPEVERLVPVIRQACPGKPIVIGGPGVTYCPELALRKTGADFAIIGEGEKALTGLLAWIEEGSIPPVGPPGISHRKIPKSLFSTGTGDITPLEDIPLPSWDKYPMHWWMRMGASFYLSIACGTDRTFTWLSSRGCPYSCNFCVSGCAPRYKSIEHLESELNKIHDLFHPTFIGWMDNLLIPNKHRCLEFCDMHRRKGWGWRYAATGHAVRIDEEMLRALKESGCASILYGVESANDHIQEQIGKHQTVAQLERAIRLTKEAGIAVQLSAMFGQPGETMQDFDRTLQMVLSAGDQEHPTHNNQGLSPIMTFPGTPLYRWAMERGYFKDDFDFYDKFFGTPDRYQGFINYTDLPREAVIEAHAIARALNDWNYHKHCYESQTQMLQNAGVL